jgi:DNA polymerase-3 subunit chi
MTQIDFYTHVEDKLKTACRLVGKAFGRKLRVAVLTPDGATTEAVDRMLWTQPAISFIPHCRADSAALQDTPVVVDHTPAELPHDDVLINLCPERPQHFSRFQRLIEIVSQDEQDKVTARERFKFYRERGYEIRTHDLRRGQGRR